MTNLSVPAQTVIRGNPVSADHEVDPLLWVTMIEELDAAATLGANAASVVGSQSSVFEIGKINSYGSSTALYELTTQGTGAGNVIQVADIDPLTGELFTLHVSGDPELSIVNKFWKHGGKVQTSVRYNSVATSEIGHQGLSIQRTETGLRRFWCCANEAESNSAYKAVRIAISDGSGTELDFSSKRVYQLFPTSMTAFTPNCTVTVERTGRFLVAELQTSNNTNVIRWFDLQTLADGGAGDYSESYVSEITITDTVNTSAGRPLQGMLADRDQVIVVTGDGALGSKLYLAIYSRTGEKIYEDSDFNIGIDEALADGAGTHHEAEGMLWFPVGPGHQVPAICIASGDSGNRVNRIWGLAMDVENHMIGVQGRPALVLRDGLAFEEEDGLEIGIYNGATRTSTPYLKIDPANPGDGYLDLGLGSSRRLEADYFYPASTTLTLETADATSGGNASSSTIDAEGCRMGDTITIKVRITSLDKTSLTSGNNLYIRGLPVWARPADTAVISFYAGTGDYTPSATTAAVSALVSSTGEIYVYETLDSGTTAIANVSQFTSSGSLTFAGSYIAT